MLDRLPVDGKRMPDAEAHGLFDALNVRLEEFAAFVAGRIRAEVEGYSSVAPAEHEQDVFVQVRATLDGLRVGRSPSDLDIALASDVGRRRADAGLPLTAVVDAYHIAYREMWSELMRMAEAGEPELVRRLAGDAGRLWGWSHQLTAAVAEAHSHQNKILATASASLRLQFLKILSDSRAEVEEGERLARRLGLDPRAEFSVVALDGISEIQLDDLAVALSGRGSPVIGCRDGQHTILVAQGRDVWQVAASLASQRSGTGVGIGMARAGIAGARLSLLDSLDALRRSIDVGRHVRFADDWLLCTLGALEARLEPLLAPAVSAARANPQWAETVMAFATDGFSAAAAARSLHLHPNSVRYRLDRWRSVTGLGPDDLVGLVSSVVAIAAARPKTVLSCGDGGDLDSP